MKKIILLLLLIPLVLVKISAQDLISHTYPFTDGPDKNPMKGWNSGWWDNFEPATVGFQYLKWSEIEPTDDNFDFGAVENVINRPGSAGRHLILRLHTDWDGEKATSDAAPAWLYSKYGVKRLKASSSNKYITDYNDPNYINQVSQAIEALAAHYEDDPRIYAIQLGVLGYWGEWHTFGYNDDNFEIADTTMEQVIAVYKNNFSNKRLMGRYPWQAPLSLENNIGFHNDFFLPNNGHSNEFTQSVFWGKKWLEGPIGGEVPPINDTELEQFKTALFGTDEGMDIIEKGHYSTMKIGDKERPCEGNLNGQRCENFMAMHRKMGYNFQITSAVFAENLSVADSLSVALNIHNIGVAPMYYDWTVQFALLNPDNQPVGIFDALYNLSSILADESIYSISLAFSMQDVPVGDYRIAVRIIQPQAAEQKPTPWGLEARNTYLLFANEIPTIEGAWTNDNALIGGWSILGAIATTNAIATSNSQVFDNTKISVYPNPAIDQLYIENNSSMLLKSIKFYGVNGRLIKTMNLAPNSAHQSLNIIDLPAGVYQLMIDSENNQIRRSFVKK